MTSPTVHELSCWQTDRQRQAQTDTTENNTTLAARVVMMMTTIGVVVVVFWISMMMKMMTLMMNVVMITRIVLRFTVYTQEIKLWIYKRINDVKKQFCSTDSTIGRCCRRHVGLWLHCLVYAVSNMATMMVVNCSCRCRSTQKLLSDACSAFTLGDRRRI